MSTRLYSITDGGVFAYIFAETLVDAFTRARGIPEYFDETLELEGGLVPGDREISCDLGGYVVKHPARIWTQLFEDVAMPHLLCTSEY